MWHIDTTKHYKIWFSEKCHEFLDVENQQRLIQTCQDNPAQTFSLIYSSLCLDEQARSELLSFCKKYGITPVDFDSDIPALLQDEQDIKLYLMAKNEIDLARKRMGGNMAAASDYARAIAPIIEHYGNYSDCDVGLKFAGIPKTLPVKAPLVFSVEVMPEARVLVPCLNNEFLSFAYNENNPSTLHPDALKRLRLVQAEKISRVSSGVKAFIENPLKGLRTDLKADSEEWFVLERFYQENPSADIYALRRYLQAFNAKEYIRIKHLQVPSQRLSDSLQKAKSEQEYIQAYIEFLKSDKIGYLLWQGYADPTETLSAEEIIDRKVAILQHKLYVLSVAGISGPVNYHAFYQEHIPPEGFTVCGNQFAAAVAPSIAWQKLITAFESSSLKANGLQECVISQNCESIRRKNSKQLQDPLVQALFSDQSWTPLGQARKTQRMKDQQAAKVPTNTDKTKMVVPSSHL